MKKIAVVLFILVFALASLAMAGKVPTPTTPPDGVTIVSASDAKPLFESKEIKAFDMRKALNYGKGHLPDGQQVQTKK